MPIHCTQTKQNKASCVQDSSPEPLLARRSYCRQPPSSGSFLAVYQCTELPGGHHCTQRKNGKSANSTNSPLSILSIVFHGKGGSPWTTYTCSGFPALPFLATVCSLAQPRSILSYAGSVLAPLALLLMPLLRNLSAVGMPSPTDMD